MTSRRLPGLDWVLVLALFLGVVTLGPIAISTGFLAVWFIVFVGVGVLSAYLWSRPRRN